MDSNLVRQASFSVDHVDMGDPESDLKKSDFDERFSSNGEAVGELGNFGKVLTRLELDLAFTSEKLVNLNVLVMHVATRESDYEAFASEKDHTSLDSAEKALEFDLLSGVLDSEVRELDKFLAVLQMEVFHARGLSSSFTHLEQISRGIEEKLRDSEQSLKQSQDQVSEIKMQSTKLQRMLSYFHGEENCKLDATLINCC